MIIEIDNVLVSTDIFTEYFCCDLDACKGICCVEGDAGAPVTIDEIAGIEDAIDTVWDDLSATAQAVIDKQGVAYTDRDGDLVTSIVGGKDCVFTCYEKGCCLCALERAWRAGKTAFCKPISVPSTPFAKRSCQTAWWPSTITVGTCATTVLKKETSCACPYIVSCATPWCAALAKTFTSSCATPLSL